MIISSSANGTITYRLPDGPVYRIAAQAGAAPENVSLALNALSAGSEDIWLNTSPDGKWLLLATDRFDAECVGWPCLATVSGDLSTGTAVRANGELIHPEGFSAVASGGNLIIYPGPGGPHTLDLWAVTRRDDGWSAPVLLTANSRYEFNHRPAISEDGRKVVFDGGNQPYGAEGTALCEVGTDGMGFRVVLTPADSPPGFPPTGALHHPDYAPDGSLVFEADWAGEQIWRLPLGAAMPVRVASQFGNDNSPCVLSDGRIVSLWLNRPGNPETVVKIIPEALLETPACEQAAPQAPGTFTFFRNTTLAGAPVVEGTTLNAYIPIETRRLPRDLLDANWDRGLTIPMRSPHVRSLNLATAVAIVMYEALRQIERF